MVATSDTQQQHKQEREAREEKVQFEVNGTVVERTKYIVYQGQRIAWADVLAATQPGDPERQALVEALEAASRQSLAELTDGVNVGRRIHYLQTMLKTGRRREAPPELTYADVKAMLLTHSQDTDAPEGDTPRTLRTSKKAGEETVQ